MRRLKRITIAVPLLLLVALGTTACPKNVDPDAVATERRLQVSLAINDITTAAAAANRAGQLEAGLELQILAINKQVLDTLEANPTTWESAVATVLTNARQALPPTTAASLGVWLTRIENAVHGVAQPREVK